MDKNLKEPLFEILLAEDNAADRRLISEALKVSESPYQLHTVRDGQELLLYLRHEGVFQSAQIPDLILLDLDMPGMDGLDALVVIKETAEWKSIPVLVLSGSRAEKDVAAAYICHANSYFVKPASMKGFEEVVRAVENYWLKLAMLPSQRKS